MTVSDKDLAVIAHEVFDTLEAPRVVSPFSARYPGFTLGDAYRVVEEVRRRREARGEKVVGRKIGFTNASAWAGYGISAPIWNYLYDTTTFDLSPGFRLPVGGRPFVRMETEVAFGLRTTPEEGMSQEQLLSCIDWAALDFEVCTSIFPDWKFQVADAAATGVHAALLLGKRYRIESSASDWVSSLRSFSATLSEAQGASFEGGGAQVLGSPLNALSRLLQELKRHGGEPLGIADIVTTGTLTAAPPVAPGDHWQASVRGLPFEEIAVGLD